MAFLRSTKRKRDLESGLAFDWRGGSSGISSFLGALALTSAAFVFAGYTLRVTLAERPGSRPLASPISLLRQTPDPLDARSRHAEVQPAILASVQEHIRDLGSPRDRSAIPLASLPQTFGAERITLPQLNRRGQTLLPSIPIAPPPPPSGEATLALGITDQYPESPRILNRPEPLEVDSETFANLIETPIQALVTIDTDGRMAAAFITDSPTRELASQARKSLEGLVFQAPAGNTRTTVTLTLMVRPQS